MSTGPQAPFELPDGYVDSRGARHHRGTIRCATARDEIRALGDFRVYLRADAFVDVMLARVVGRLGDLERVDVGVIERLSRRDRDFLEDLYREINGY